MKDFDDAPYDEIIIADPFELKDREVRSLIARLAKHRKQQLRNVVPSVSALNARIELAHHELAIRSSSKLARIAIVIATLSFVVTATTLAVTFLSEQPSQSPRVEAQ